jgi:hypothetical protein
VVDFIASSVPIVPHALYAIVGSRCTPDVVAEQDIIADFEQLESATTGVSGFV